MSATPKPAATPAGQGASLLSARVARLLDARLDAHALADALYPLSVGGVPSTTAPPPPDSRHIRQYMRTAAEEQCLASAKAFCAAYAPLAEGVSALAQRVERIAAESATAERALAASSASSVAFSAEVRALKERKAALQASMESAQSFLRRFELNEAEAAALRRGPSMDEAGMTEFLNALEKCARIRQHSVTLIAGEHHALGMDLLTRATRQQADGLYVLFEWAQQACKDADALSAVDAAAAGPTSAQFQSESGDASGAQMQVLRRALTVLAVHRPALYRTCQDAMVSTLRASLIRRFLKALASSGFGTTHAPSGRTTNTSSTAAESGLQDAARFVGDMLAWLHLALAEVQEAVTLLTPHADAAATARALGAGEEATSPASPTTSDAVSALNSSANAEAAALLSTRDILTAVCDSVSKPLGTRVDQALRGTHSLAVIFQVADVLSFYVSMLTPLLTPDASLVCMLYGCYGMASTQFNMACAAAAERVRSAAAALPADLSTSPSIVSLVSQMESVFKCHATGLSADAPAAAARGTGAASSASSTAGGGAGASAADASNIRTHSATSSPSEGAVEEAPPVLFSGDAFVGVMCEELVPAMLSAARASADGLRTADAAAYQLNTAAHIQSSLAPFAAAAPWVQRLAGEMDTLEESLVQQVSMELLQASGLLQLLTDMRDTGVEGAATVIDRLPAALRSFNALVTSASLMNLFERITSPRLRARLRRDALRVVAAAYAQVFDAAHEPSSPWAAPAAIAAQFKYKPEEVSVMLDVA